MMGIHAPDAKRHFHEEDAMTAPPHPLHREADQYVQEAVEESIKKKLQPWFQEFYEWGCKVRDDILALEDAVIDLADGKPPKKLSFQGKSRSIEEKKNRYKPRHSGRHGDPGDPPGDPWEQE
jgi:hypothetical protein